MHVYAPSLRRQNDLISPSLLQDTQVTVMPWFPSTDTEKSGTPKQVFQSIFQEVSLNLEQNRPDIATDSSVFIPVDEAKGKESIQWIVHHS